MHALSLRAEEGEGACTMRIALRSESAHALSLRVEEGEGACTTRIPKESESAQAHQSARW